MGRTIYAEERLLDYLKSLTRVDGYTVGLILGQSTEKKDYVVHLARTPPPATKDVIEEPFIGASSNSQPETETKCIKSLEDIPKNWVADHAKHVTKMLPGGMWVLGVFVAGPEDSLNNQNSVNVMKSVMTDVHKNLGANKYMFGNNEYENLALSFNNLSQKCTCKCFDAKRSGSVKPADWKFQSRITKWQSLETRVDFDETFPISNEDDSKILKKQLRDIVLKNTAASINSALAIFDGEAKALNETIETAYDSSKRKKIEPKESGTKNNETNSSDKIRQIRLYIPCPKSSSMEINKVACSASIRLVGQLVSRTFVHEKANVDESTNAVKQDVIRSLATRLEMHWDSLIEEENGSPEENVTLHEPPRRVLIELPQSRITLSDYLFPGEGPQEALISLQELLDLEVQESNVQKEIELQVDPTEFYCQNEEKKESGDTGKLSKKNLQIMPYIIGLVVGILMSLLLNVILEYVLQTT